MDREKIEELLADTKIKVPKDITSPQVGRKFYKEVRKSLLPARANAFGNVKVSFKDQKASAEEIFGSQPITYGEVTKAIHKFINSNNLKVGGKAKATDEEEED